MAKLLNAQSAMASDSILSDPSPAPAPAPAQTNAATSKQPETAAANKPRKRRQRYISQNMDDKAMAKLLNASSPMAADSILSDKSPAQTNAETSKQPETAAANKPKARRQRYISQNTDDRAMAKLLNSSSAMAADSILSDKSPAQTNAETSKKPEAAAANKPKARRQRFISQNTD